MKCPYLERGKRAALCTASVTLMVPSVFEEEAYCRTEEHRRCQVLCAQASSEGHKNRPAEGEPGPA